MPLHSGSTIRRLDRSDLSSLLSLARESNEGPYDLAAVLDEKIFGPGVSGEPETLGAFRNGKCVGMAVRCGRFLRLLLVARDARREGIGSSLLEAVGPCETVGAEPGNYFTPGVASDDFESTSFFHARGFRPSDRLNIDLVLPLPPREQPGPLPDATIVIRRAGTHERDAIRRFIEEQFGRAWALEALRALDHPDPILHVAGRSGSYVAFAAGDANNHGLGGFGPTGTIRAARGCGIGSALLSRVLGELSARGYQEAIIPWVAETSMYRRVGAKPAHRFLVYTR
ncbi:MAG: GNAT family N-acetyltransferase [Thermoanaerobaculia bacterium]